MWRSNIGWKWLDLGFIWVLHDFTGYDRWVQIDWLKRSDELCMRGEILSEALLAWHFACLQLQFV